MKTVTIYSTPTCPYCHAAKEFFKEHNVPFTDHDVASDAVARAEMVKKSGQMGVPVILVDDDMEIGFDEDRLRDLLSIH